MGNVYLLTPWSRVLLEKLTGSPVSQEIPRIFGTRRFLNVLTSARHLSLSWANSIQSSQPPPTSWRSILILSSHLSLGLPNGLFPSGFLTRTLCTPLLLLLLLLLLHGESENYTSLKVPRQCPLTLPLKEGLKLGKSLGSKAVWWEGDCWNYAAEERSVQYSLLTARYKYFISITKTAAVYGYNSCLDTHETNCVGKVHIFKY